MCFSFYLWFQSQVVQPGVVKVPLGKVHIDLAQEAVPAKGVVMPHGENERLGLEILHANAILQRQQARRFCLPIVEHTSGNDKAWESAGVCLAHYRAVVSYSEDLIKQRVQCLLFHRCFSLSQVSFVRKQVAFHIS